MINRELIRIKTIQLLYSYLLVENPFSLESQPSAPTKEKRFAYSLYLDILNLMTRVASKVEVNRQTPLYDTRFIRNVLADEKIKSLQAKENAARTFPFADLVPELAAAVKESAILKRALKYKEDDIIDENIWKDIFELILMPNTALNEEISRRENFSLKGVDRMRGLMEETFRNFFASADNLPDALKVLKFSMDKTREFYVRLLSLPIAITELRRRDIENARFKFLKTAEDINPSLRFVENQYVKTLEEDEELRGAIAYYKIDWIAEDENLVRSLLKKIMQSNLYVEYMEKPLTDFHEDCELWRSIYKFIIFIDENFLELLEDKSVFWNDDIDIIGTFILKTIKRLGNSTEEKEKFDSVLLPMYRNDEDARFGAELFSEVIRNKDYYRNLILSNVDSNQWEAERLAFMDVVIMMTALAEIMKFPKIPLTVSLNEYIEIAKYYSTAKSGGFINGFLYNIISKLQQEGKILKTFNNK